MHAERVMLETDISGKLIKLPKLPANTQFEVIFLAIDGIEPQPKKRSPHPDILAKMKIKGDIFDSSPSADWSILNGSA